LVALDRPMRMGLSRATSSQGHNRQHPSKIKVVQHKMPVRRKSATTTTTAHVRTARKDGTDAGGGGASLMFLFPSSDGVADDRPVDVAVSIRLQHHPAPSRPSRPPCRPEVPVRGHAQFVVVTGLSPRPPRMTVVDRTLKPVERPGRAPWVG